MGAAGGRRASELVHAVWTRRQPVPATGLPMTRATALDRFAHSVHRFHDRVEVMPDRVLRRELQLTGELLDSCLAAARSAGRGRDGAREDAAAATRDILRAGTLCAHATEAAVAAAAARRGGDAAEVTRAIASARALADLVTELINPSGEGWHHAE